MKRAALIAIVVCLGFAPGCADLMPSWAHPGPAELQRLRAEHTDPYPNPDLGPNDLGARPTSYDRPVPENEGIQNESAYADRYHTPPPPGLYHGISRGPLMAPVRPGGAPPLTEAPAFVQ